MSNNVLILERFAIPPFICCMANRDEKKVIKQMIRSGDIKQFRDIFRYAQITPVIKHLNSNHTRLQAAISDIAKFKVGTLVKIADFFELDEKTMMDLVVNQLVATKRKRKS